VLEPIKAWGRPLIGGGVIGGGVVGGGVVDGATVIVLVTICESAQERKHITKRTDTCILKIY
jgi:hypothetical protein